MSKQMRAACALWMSVCLLGCTSAQRSPEPGKQSDSGSHAADNGGHDGTPGSAAKGGGGDSGRGGAKGTAGVLAAGGGRGGPNSGGQGASSGQLPGNTGPAPAHVTFQMKGVL